jgi:hypothetical protein
LGQQDPPTQVVPAEQVTPPQQVPAVTHLPPQHSWPDEQHADPQTRALGQQAPPAQVWPAPQQIPPHAWSLGQQVKKPTPKTTMAAQVSSAVQHSAPSLHTLLLGQHSSPAHVVPDRQQSVPQFGQQKVPSTQVWPDPQHEPPHRLLLLQQKVIVPSPRTQV